jgi:ASC-1-like (ASCH) protein
MPCTARKIAGALLAMLLLSSGVFAQEPPAQTVDEISEDIDVLEQLNTYGFTVEQLQAMVPILKELDAKRQVLEAYKRSDEALAPMRALRDALIEGKAADQLQTNTEVVWDRMMELEDAYEEAIPGTMKKIAALLTDDQLAALSVGDEWAYDETDRIFATLDTARDFDDDTFSKWRDQTARQIAFRGAAESEEKAKQIQDKVKQFLDKARKMKEDEYMDQYDDLFDELQTLIAGSQPKPLREVVEAQAAEELEYVMRSERILPLIEAQVKARGGG